VRKQFQEILENVLMHEKYSKNCRNFRKNPRDALGHEQSNKIFGVHEKKILEPK
jgi:hypothetical protein